MQCDGAAPGNHVGTLVEIPFKLQLRRNLVTAKVAIGRTGIYKYTATCEDIDGNQFTEESFNKTHKIVWHKVLSWLALRSKAIDPVSVKFSYQ